MNLRRAIIIALAIAASLTSPVSAISSNDLKSVIYDTAFYDDTPAVTGDGDCTSLTTPTINDKAGLVAAFTQFAHKRGLDSSPLIPVFGNIIEGATAAGWNPLLVVTQAQMESQLATDKSVYGLRGYNAWGREASASQPGIVSPGGRRWYAWTSWVDAVQTSSDNYSVYNVRKWITEAHYTTIDQYVMKYAPPSDGNNTTQYIQNIKDWINEIVGYAGPALSCGGSVGSNGVVAGSIVKTALGLAWPDNKHQPQSEATPAYLAVWNPNHISGRVPTDCGMFVSTVMRVSGVDTSFPGINQGADTTIMENYILRNPDKYTAWHPKSTSELQPGDIMIFKAGDAAESTGHTLIWVGKQANGLAVAEASGTTRAPMLNIADNAAWMIRATGGAVYAARHK